MWDIEELLRVIKAEVEAREMTEGIKINEAENLPRKGTLPTTSAFVTRDGSSND